VLVRDQEVDVVGRAGSINGVALDAVTARARPEAEEGSWLTIHGSADMDAPAGHQFLLTTPLHELLGTTFDSWIAEGQLSAVIDLGIPLGGSPREREIDV